MGGAIYNEGTIDFQSSSITYNSADLYGGGVANKGIFTSTESDISYNEALYAGGGVANWESFTLESGAISYNTCLYTEMGDSISGDYGAGGGMWNGGILTINGGQISNNCCYQKGGGIFNSAQADWFLADSLTHENGIVYMTGGQISHNTAEYHQGNMYWGFAGGVFNRGEFYMDDGTITENRGIVSAGGLYNAGHFEMTAGQIGNNSIGVDLYDSRSNRGEEIQSGYFYDLAGVKQNIVTVLTGGSIYPSEELSFADNMISICGPGSKFEIGGEVLFPENNSIALQNSTIEVISTLKKVSSPIAVYPVDYKGDGITIDGNTYAIYPYDASAASNRIRRNSAKFMHTLLRKMVTTLSLRINLRTLKLRDNSTELTIFRI